MLLCPYCEMEITDRGIDRNDGCCPHCGTFLDHVDLEDDDELDDDDDMEDFGAPTRLDAQEPDEFDEFLEEEDKLNSKNDEE